MVDVKLVELSAKGFCNGCLATKLWDELKICSRCRNARYCSKSCQKAHWKKTHKQFCKTPEQAKRESDAESWNNVYKEFGHKQTSMLTPVTESLDEQVDRLENWVEEWKSTLSSWAFWSFNIPASREDVLSNFSFVFEVQRRAEPPSPAHYFEMHGAEIMHTSEVIWLFEQLKRHEYLKHWSHLPRRNDLIQIIVMWKGHVIDFTRQINDRELRKKGPDARLLYDALAKDWIDELRKAIDSGNPDYHKQFYNVTFGETAMDVSFRAGVESMRKATEQIRGQKV